MQTESTIDTRTIERTARISLVRVVDFEELVAKYPEGTMPTEALQTAGDFVIVVDPNGRDAKQARFLVDDEATGTAWLNGFEECARMKTRTPKTPAEKAEAKKKRAATKKKKEAAEAKAAASKK